MQCESIKVMSRDTLQKKSHLLFKTLKNKKFNLCLQTNLKWSATVQLKNRKVQKNNK